MYHILISIHAFSNIPKSDNSKLMKKLCESVKTGLLKNLCDFYEYCKYGAIKIYAIQIHSTAA